MDAAIATTIVPELLEQNNYERWSIFMKSYLVSQDLWVVICRNEKPLGVSKTEWRKKNAAALHAMQISCGSKAFEHIKKYQFPVNAWEKLKLIFCPVEDRTALEDEEGEETPKITTANMIVPELLERGNYERWSFCMKSYLVSQDLWNAVVHNWEPDSGVSKKDWIKKDAAALHAIQISCGANKFDEIKKIDSAKDAWIIFEKKHKEEPSSENGSASDDSDLFRDSDFQTMERTQSLVVQNAIDKGDVHALMDHFKRNSGEEKWGFWRGHAPLHYATMAGKLNIVEALVQSIPAVQEQRDAFGATALRHAAAFGQTEIAKYLLSEDSNLVSVEDKLNEEIPVVTACRLGHTELTYFLYSKTPSEILFNDNGKQGYKLLLECFKAKRFDIMLDALHRCPSLSNECWKNLLDEFARTPVAFISGSGLTFWQQWIYKCLKVNKTGNFCVVTINQQEKTFEEMPVPGRLWRLASILLPFLGIKQIYALKLSHVSARESLQLICQHLSELPIRSLKDSTALSESITRAIENGIYEFLIEMANTNADLLSAPPRDETIRRNLLMDAIVFRQEKIARFIIELPLGKTLFISRDGQQNNVLHITGQVASDLQLSHVSGAALKMQREIQWFKDVESLVPQYLKDAKNDNGETPYQVLTREHKDFLKEAEDWTKGLASSYIIVGTLIVTIMFAAAFTLPGGNSQDEGFPIFKNKAAFMIYIISDAISLFAAAASVLIFLGFLTSSYNVDDFHKSIPRKLMIGLSALFISLAAMMIAFCSAFFLILENRWWIIIPSVLLAGIPVSLFVWLQFPLLLQICLSTYKSPIFSKKRCLASKIKAFFLGKKKKTK